MSSKRERELAVNVADLVTADLQAENTRLRAERDQRDGLLRRIVRMIQAKEHPAAFIDSILCEWDGVGVDDDGLFVLKGE